MEARVAFENPITSLRLLVASVPTSYAPFLTAIGGVKNVQIWDRAVDVRGDLKKSAGAKRRLQLRPTASDLDFNWSSGSARFARRYAIDVYSTGTEVAPVEYLEWLLWKGYGYLFDQRLPGSDDPIVVPEPLILDSISLTAADPDREDLDGETEGWTTICDAIATGTVSIAALTTEA